MSTPNLPPEEVLTFVRDVFAQEASALLAAADSAAPSLANLVSLLLAHQGGVVCTGLGKSGIIAHKVAATLSSTGTPSTWMNAADALHGDLGTIRGGDIVFMFSNSGRTHELLAMVPLLKRALCRIVGFLGDCSSPLASLCDYTVNVHVQKEACPLGLAPTTSATTAMVAGDALACALSICRGFTESDFGSLHPGGSLGERLNKRASEIMRSFMSIGCVAPKTPMRAVLEVMTTSRMGAAIVCNDARHLLGVITDGDIRRHVLHGGDYGVPAEDIMTTSPKYASPHSSLSSLLSAMETPGHLITVLPIVSDHEVVGAVHLHDILGHCVR